MQQRLLDSIYHRLFWATHPALSIGISFLLSIGSTLFALPPWILGGWALYLTLLRKWAALCLIPFACLYAHLLFGHQPELEHPIHCTAYFSISSLQPHSSPFQKDLLYRGTLYYNQNALPCTVIWKKKKRPRANVDYELSGLLIQRDKFDYCLNAQTYKPIPNSWSLAELRYKAKQKFSRFLHKKLHRPRTALLLSSLATGELDDRMLRFEFGRLGLQHLLAVSGFHFGVLLLFLSSILGLILPHRFKWSALLLFLTAYFLFIGSSAAVQRAWIVASLVLMAKILRKSPNALNLLGAALFIELALNPLIAAQLGFQLSFLCCFGILLFYESLEKSLQTLLPKRTLNKNLRLAPFSKALFLFSKIFRPALAITLSVNATILPLLFYHFGHFPLLGLLYNLFFPFLVSIDLIILMTTLILHLLAPWTALPLFSLVDWLTAQLLDLVSYPPLLLDYSLYCPELPFFVIPIYLSVLFAFGIRLYNQNEIKKFS